MWALRKERRDKDAPNLDKVAESVGVLDSDGRLVGQVDLVHLHEIGQELDGPIQGCFAGPGERESVQSDFEHGHGHRPHVRVDPVGFSPSVQFKTVEMQSKSSFHLRVLATAYPFGREVVRRADKGAGETVDEFARDAEIAELDQTVARDQHIRRFDVCA